jgi:hypothetical protein
MSIFRFFSYYERFGEPAELPGTWFIERIVHRDVLEQIPAQIASRVGVLRFTGM